jgi:phage tail sheath protein FI
MGFQVSPGVQVNEIDLTNVVPAVATSIGASAGAFQKGPVNSPTLITSEEELLRIFGRPQNTSNQFESWFTVANFLAYTDACYVTRAQSAIVNAGASGGVLIRDDDHYENSFNTGQGSVGEWAARTAGTHGNSLGVSMCPSATAYQQSLGANNQVNQADVAVGDNVITVDNADASGFAINVGDLLSFYSDANYTSPADNYREYQVTAVDTSSNVVTLRLKDNPDGVGFQTAIPDNSFILRRWKFYDLFTSAPGTSAYATQNGRGTGDEMHVVVYDTTGDITGNDNDVAGQNQSSVIETYSNLSKNSSAKSPQGDSIYYADVIFRQSAFIYWMDHNSAGTNWGTDTTSAYTAVNTPTLTTLSGGTDDYAVTAGEMQVSFEKYLDSDNIEVNLLLGGSSSLTTDSAAGQDTFVTMITNVVETRKDCVGFVSPYRAATVGVADSNTQTDNVQDAFDLCPSSSYMVFDSGYKYMYDKYNDVYRFVPLNGDTAGLCAYTDRVADAWFSPGGLNRGNVRNAIKLSYNPTKANRDFLYRARVNPVVNFPGQGVVLFGDKTALSKPSAFDRINVRRLFLVLEKAIATASKFQLFEFNDEFTRAQFRNLIEPFLRDVQGRRGITDFLVKCDATNNTGEVIDRNEFIADIFVKPARSINFITLNFIATRTGVAFSEVGG